MIKFFKYLFLFFVCENIIPAIAQTDGYPYQHLDLKQVKLEDGFWQPRLQIHRLQTIPAAIVQLRDSTARINNFEIAAGLKQGKFQGLVWDDSDVYKVMEGIAYSLMHHPDPQLEQLMDYWIDVMAKAQQPDGYLVTFYILSTEDDALGKNLGRWSDIGRHEMYCGGHMIEAAIAYYYATGKSKFLEVARKFADHWLSVFGPGKRHWAEGHQEPELALVKLYNVTGEKKYLDFAYWLLEERGHGHEFGPMWEANPRANVDILSDIPVKEITEAKGHAVRAMYMYSAMADVLAHSGDTTYRSALNTVWDDVVYRKMYVTGGVGSMHDGEAFGPPYYLPNKEAYCETCANIGMVLWNSRMNRLTGHAKYANVLERVLYNAVLAGQNLDGSRFFYTNPLASEGKVHRGGAYGIACCPTNMARFIPQVPGFIYALSANELLVNLYVGSNTTTLLNGVNIAVIQKTNYPWEGNVRIIINPEKDVKGTIKLRIPDWCRSYKASINGKRVIADSLVNGYLALDRLWRKFDRIDLKFDMPVSTEVAHPKVVANMGRRAVYRGPLIYCMEEVDNPTLNFEALKLSSKNRLRLGDGETDLKGLKTIRSNGSGKPITLVPYFAWENRISGRMQVWIPYEE